MLISKTTTSTLTTTAAPTKLLVFSDFDGTLSTHDTGVVLIDEWLGRSKRKELDGCIFDGTMAMRDVFTIMWNSVRDTLDAARQKLAHVELDDGVQEFLTFAESHQVPVTVVSAGLDILIEEFLEKAGMRVTMDRTKFIEELGTTQTVESGLPQVLLVCNKGEANTEKGWQVEYADESSFGHDKALTIRTFMEEYKKVHHRVGDENVQLKTVFIGDGISDISAARCADIVFARRGLDLHKWCVKNGAECVTFDSFKEVTAHLQQMVSN
ncbi:HAD-like protein [Ramicandelaber brevisporus]|nr:HAD-like protein [Ramicandelaber brevisporus]